MEDDEVSGPPPHDLLIGEPWDPTGEIIDTYTCPGCGASYVSVLARDACCQD